MNEPDFIPFEPSYTVDEFCKAERISRVALYDIVEAGQRPALLFEWKMQAHHARSQNGMAA